VGAVDPRKLMKRPRILLADDHTLMAEALKHLLQADFDVVGTVGDGRALLEAAAQLHPDLVVVDIAMPLLNGLDAGEQLKALHPHIKVIYLTQNREPRIAAEALRRKASGYLLKDSAASELTAAIREALQGRCYVSPSIAAAMADADLSPGTQDARLRDLSPREREVLQLLAEGKSMKEVAAILDISPRTVEFHKYRTMELLGLKTGAELVQYAIRHGLIGP
jgi:DNA-binding NarL/FixJ family response regulator